MAVEPRNWIRKDFSVEFAALEILVGGGILVSGDIVVAKAEDGSKRDKTGDQSHEGQTNGIDIRL